MVESPPWPPAAIETLAADWDAPAHVHAFTTTRAGGVSLGHHAGLNLGLRCGDVAATVDRNRRLLRALLPEDPAWVRQTHGIKVVELPVSGEPEADAVWTQVPGVVCAILTADCLPVVFCNRAGTRVAAAHAGWRGLAAGVLEATVEALQTPGEELQAWLGPAIGQQAFEVGPEVRAAFLARDPEATDAFRPGQGDRWHADLHQLARQRLGRLGVTRVAGSSGCTWSEADRFYSFRRDGTTGRMATLIWMRPV